MEKEGGSGKGEHSGQERQRPLEPERAVRVGGAETHLGDGCGQSTRRRRGGELVPMIEGEKKHNRPGGKRQTYQPAAYGCSPAPAGEARRRNQDRRQENLQAKAHAVCRL